jgi:hypothetical protein
MALVATLALAGCGSAGGDSSAGAAPGSECSTEGAQTGMENGTLECVGTADGLRWQPMDPSTGGTQGAPDNGSTPTDGDGNGNAGSTRGRSA